jgi:dimethylaniline monooxygenase (N-oxide forming)
MTSFSDVALELPEDTPKLHDTFAAKYVTQYLEDYVDSHVYDGKPLRSRIWFNAEVHSVEKIGSGWTLQVHGAVSQSLRCSKLIVASGLTSSPNIPEFPRNSDWMMPILHHRDFGAHSKAILETSSAYKHITVLGGGKSAADMVYASVKAGKYVNWIVRKTGEGPGIFMNPAATGRYRNNAEAGATQNATTLNPSGFRPMHDWALTMHQTESEKGKLESKLFAADRRYKQWANYRERKGALPGFRELEPRAS